MKNRHSNLKKKLLRRQRRCWWAKNKENYYENDNGPAQWVQFGVSSPVDARQWWKVRVVPLLSCSSSITLWQFLVENVSSEKKGHVKMTFLFEFWNFLSNVLLLSSSFLWELLANVWFTSAVPRLLHPGYFFSSDDFLRKGFCFLWGYMNISSNIATS